MLYLNIYQKKNKNIKFVNIRNLEPLQIEKFVKKMFDKYSKIAILFYGNPLFLNYISEILLKIKNIEIITFPAISSFDYIFHIFPCLNIFSKKIIILNNIVIEEIMKSDKKIKFELGTHFFIFGTEAIVKSKKSLDFLITSLKSFYDSKYEIFLLHINDLSYKRMIIKKIKVENLKEYLKKQSIMQTIYIPPKKY